MDAAVELTENVLYAHQGAGYIGEMTMSIVQLDLLGQLAPLQFQSIAQAALALEAYQTPRWAAEAGLSAVPLQKRVLDTCVGRGILAQTALARGH